MRVLRTTSNSGFGRLFTLIVASLIACIPLVSYLWETVNQLLSGHVDAGRLVISVPLLVLFLACLALIGRSLQRLDAQLRE
ncbi:MAG TPA: hypothetical protein VKZ58_13810 [Longimicrobiales bacterium]|nr:hypothetical protein [Longimicrobiales bacterium]